MSREFIEYALDSKEGQDWIEFFRNDFFIPDESWAQTILGNSKFKMLNIGNEEPFFIRFQKDGHE
eukprot:scaffold239819_cov41-Prasinocladus_malaysianus.AAC.1